MNRLPEHFRWAAWTVLPLAAWLAQGGLAPMHAGAQDPPPVHAPTCTDDDDWASDPRRPC